MTTRRKWTWAAIVVLAVIVGGYLWLSVWLSFEFTSPALMILSAPHGTFGHIYAFLFGHGAVDREIDLCVPIPKTQKLKT